MVDTIGIDSSQGSVLAIGGQPTKDTFTSQGVVETIVSATSTALRASQAWTQSTNNASSPMRVSQAAVLGAMAGRVQNFNMRAWTFSMDGHDFYVLQCGESGTLVYDVTTQQWMTWESTPRDVKNWRVQTGTNWNSHSNFINDSDIIGGDDTTGMLWYLDADQAGDGDGFDVTGNVVLGFQRILTGGIPARGRSTIQCNYVFLTGSLGEPLPADPEIDLSTSDDNGKTYQDQGTIDISAGNFTEDVTWFSLGSFGAPGRIFRITDMGALERIDSLDMG